MWFRRDLRLGDHPSLMAAADEGPVVPLFVLDPRLAGRGGRRLARLHASLHALSASMDGALVVRTGDPAQVVPELAAAVGAGAVHVTRETTPYGTRRDQAVRAALESFGVRWAEIGTPYAVGPGLVTKGDGTPYQVFTPFARAWRTHGWPRPAPMDPEVTWHPDAVAQRLHSEPIRAPTDPAAERGRAQVGEAAALAEWEEWRDDGLAEYGQTRDRPDLDATSRLSVPLKYGEIHPRTILAGCDETVPGVSTFVRELAWREFYADVLHHNPSSAWADLRPALRNLAYDDPADCADLVEAWRTGRTGYPIVDAGMRQLLGEGWMHNRVRMITASFLVKDLHVWWPLGAWHFMDHLLDGDLASNSHCWQWVAGTGTDAAPYFRIFNPVTQGKGFDPDGTYVRRWVPELRHLSGVAAHEPWRHPEGYAGGYPERIVDHDTERRETLARYQAATR